MGGIIAEYRQVEKYKLFQKKVIVKMRQISKGIHDVRNHSQTGKIQGALPVLHHTISIKSFSKC
jgi:hypothetical protein